MTYFDYEYPSWGGVEVRRASINLEGSKYYIEFLGSLSTVVLYSEDQDEPIFKVWQNKYLLNNKEYSLDWSKCRDPYLDYELTINNLNIQIYQKVSDLEVVFGTNRLFYIKVNGSRYASLRIKQRKGRYDFWKFKTGINMVRFSLAERNSIDNLSIQHQPAIVWALLNFCDHSYFD